MSMPKSHRTRRGAIKRKDIDEEEEIATMVEVSRTETDDDTSKAIRSKKKALRDNDSSRFKDDENILDYMSDESEHVDENGEDDEHVLKKKTKTQGMGHTTDYWKLPKKHVVLSQEEAAKLERMKHYFEDVIDKHQLIIE
jgi:hypothetical protein